MELQEAISHAREVAAGNHPGIDGCSECAKEHAQLADWLDELQIYRQLREQGLLVRIPCKVGDTVFRIWNGEIEQYQVVSVWFNDHIKRRFHAECFPFMRFYDEDIGKRVFLTREETEAALAKEG